MNTSQALVSEAVWSSRQGITQESGDLDSISGSATDSFPGIGQVTSPVPQFPHLGNGDIATYTPL